MPKVLKLNEISGVVADVFAPHKFELVKDCADPVAIMLRSFDMHGYALPESTLCVGRAGAGVNNIPHADYAQKGVVVFNTPGANANAVKELVICSLLLCGRKIADGIAWSQSLKGKGAEVPKLVESGKKAFAGSEILGKTLGVVGLGAIGSLVANIAVELGMKVIGFDPYISIDAAWNLNSNVQKASDLDSVLANSDFITLHIPYLPATKGMISADAIAKMKQGANLINCSRGELVDNTAIKAAIKAGKINRYVTDFPCEELLGVENVITIPHLGASTEEAEDNCARMAAAEIVDFVENGNIVNSVNFPNCKSDRRGKQRVTVFHKNVKNVISSISDVIAKEGINISGFNSQASGDMAYAILDLDEAISPATENKIRALDNIVRVRIV
ncbi:MAG: 3-phosphoglycerate dehydrogenase [Clostridiales bacterium]|nr:3-phosphoglycerate dehydrogenase [Clostridiales bacterium]